MSAKTSVVSDLRNHEGTKPLQMSDFATDICGPGKENYAKSPSPSRTFELCSGPSAT